LRRLEEAGCQIVFSPPGKTPDEEELRRLLEEEAVLAALDSGRLAGLATDVFPEEPPRDLQLLRHPKVIATAHLGGFTTESVSRAVEAAVDNLLASLDHSNTNI
jgi:phosphoglycerate dehydrogenase-like enzyme